MGLGGNGAVSALITAVILVIFLAVSIKLSLHSERPSTCSFPFFLFIFWPCAIEDCSHQHQSYSGQRYGIGMLRTLKKVRCSPSHP